MVVLIDNYTFSESVRDGLLENMKWLKDNGCPFNAFTFHLATLHGNQENIEWLVSVGCPQ